MLLLAACSTTDPAPEERGQFAEPEPALPASSLPPAGLVEFEERPRVATRYYIDPASITVFGQQDVVRYLMVVRASGGAVNVSYEGFRCDAGLHRIYAVGQADGSWARRGGDWRDARATGSPERYALYRYYFCPEKMRITNAREGADALARGGHPRGRPESGLLTPGGSD